MADIAVTPDTLPDRAARARPGDVLRLSPGRYAAPLTLEGITGTAAAPIVIAGDASTVFDGGRRFEDFRQEANREAGRVHEAGGYPGLHEIAGQGFIRLGRCRHLRLQGFRMVGCWPTGIAIDDCRNVAIAGLAIEEGTFAIHARGAATRGLLIEDCRWLQDIGRGRIWSEIDWDLIHARRPVTDADARAFDGDFFRAFGITGDVEIRGCLIEHAFNGIHVYNSDPDGADPRQNRNVRIHGNTFRYIRDNAIEPERGAWNWWIWHNDIFNCHKWYSFEMYRSGHIYVFGNTGWFDSLPGPPGDDNVGGEVFKMPSISRPSTGRHYIFHNSFYLRSKYIKKKRLARLDHFSNAIQYCAAEAHPAGVCAMPVSVFGYPRDPAEESDDEKRQFTKRWQELEIRFFADVVDHPDYPDLIRARGYPLGPGTAAPPGFRDAPGGDFRLARGAAARGAGAAEQRIDLPGGRIWTLPGGLDAGAWQGGVRLPAHPFVPYDPAAAGPVG